MQCLIYIYHTIIFFIFSLFSFFNYPISEFYVLSTLPGHETFKLLLIFFLINNFYAHTAILNEANLGSPDVSILYKLPRYAMLKIVK